MPITYINDKTKIQAFCRIVDIPLKPGEQNPYITIHDNEQGYRFEFFANGRKSVLTIGCAGLISDGAGAFSSTPSNELRQASAELFAAAREELRVDASSGDIKNIGGELAVAIGQLLDMETDTSFVSYRRQPGKDSYREVGCYASDEMSVVKMWDNGKVEFTHIYPGDSSVSVTIDTDNVAKITSIQPGGIKDTAFLSSKDAIDDIRQRSRNALRMALKPAGHIL